MAEPKRIVLTASDSDFFSGYQAGYIHYITHQKGTPLTDDTIDTFVRATLSDEQQTSRFKIGYVSGWYAALYNKSYRMEDVPVKLTLLKGSMS